MALAEPPGDEHAVLGAEVNYDDGLPFPGGEGLRLGHLGLAVELLGDAEVGGDLYIVACRNAVALLVCHLSGMQVDTD